MSDVLCECGQVAITEIQVGWDRTANGGAGGGVYELVCEACYEGSEEAMAYRAVHATILLDVRAGRYQREDRHPGHGPRWYGPRGRNHSDDEHRRLLADPMTDDEARLAIAAEASRAAKYEY